MAKYSRRYRKKRGRRHRRRSRKLRGGFKRAVIRAVRSTREIKVKTKGGSFDLFGTIGSTAPGLMGAGLENFLPQVSQGVTHRDRIGNEINVTKLILKMWIQYGTNASPNDQAVDAAQMSMKARVMILKQKNLANSKSIADGFTSPFQSNKLLQSGGFVNVSSNSYRNIMSPINRDHFVSKYDRKRKITNNYYQQISGSALPVHKHVVPANPHNFVTFSKTMRFKNGKPLKYINSSDTMPQAWPYFIAAGYAATNGLPTINDTNATLMYDCTMYYTDA